jgi:HlyD family secretion protein
MNRTTIITLASIVLLLQACESGEETYMVGTLERDRIELKVENNEPIRSINVEDGQSVAAGDLVLEQDSARAEARLAQLESQRDQAAARLAELQRGPREESIREARARLEGARANRVNAAANLERTREVYERGLSSAGQLDTDQTRLKTAIAEEQAASEAVDKLLYQLGERPSPGTTVAVLLDSARSYARVYVPEHLRAQVRPGTSLDVRVDGVEGILEGRVRWVSSDASFTPYFALTEHDRSRLSYLAEIDLPGAQDLPSGLPLEVDFPRE